MEDYFKTILILIGIFIIIPSLHSVYLSFTHTQFDTFYNRENNRENNEITIIIPSIYRKDKNYINETLSELYKQKTPSTKVNIFIHIGDYQHNKEYEISNSNSNSKNDISFYIDDKFKQNPDVQVLKTFKDEYGNLLKKHKYENGGDYMFWRSKQNLDYYFAIKKTLSKTNNNYILFLEDDQKAIANWDNEIFKNINVMEKNQNICHTKMSPLGMCAYLYNRNHMDKFANYMKAEYNKDPCDWLIKDFVEKNSLEMIHSPKYVFQHEGEVSSLINKKQMLKVNNL
jgi:hypothetical protein